MNPGKLIGSVDLLADAMQKVFSGAVERADEPPHIQVKALRTDMGEIRTYMHSMEERPKSQISLILKERSL